MRMTWVLLFTILLAAGCNDSNPVRDLTPPAAPRGVFTVTGDHEVTIQWLANTEPDVAGYRVYQSPCSGVDECQVGTTTGTRFVVTSLTNGVTRFFAVSAYDRAGNQGDLAYENLVDTPRPAGFGRVLANYLDPGTGSGYDFSGFAVRAWNDTTTDMYFGSDGSTYLMLVPDYNTDIQDAGYAASLDAVDVAPSLGWSPTGTAELIVGHCYVVWTRDDHYAKFRVTDVKPPAPGVPAQVTFDWAYQVDRGNPELRAKKVRDGTFGGLRPPLWAVREG